MSQLFSKNLKRLRTEKNYTQEEAAQILGVTAQTVSRWECGTTLPDVMLLPEIAKLYCVTVDDLYNENSDAYDNYAQRLADLYSSSREPEDFVRADEEFRKLMNSGKCSPDDLRCYGILHQYMTAYCIGKATELFDKGLDLAGKNDPTYWKLKRQKIYFLSMIGRGQESIEQQLKIMEEAPEDPEEWMCTIAAYTHAGETETAYEWFLKTTAKFPDCALLYVYGGDLCREMKRYEEAFEHWDHALRLDGSICDAKFSKGFCYEEMGEYRKAYEIWTGLEEEIKQRGLTYSVQLPRQLAENCAKKIACP